MWSVTCDSVWNLPSSSLLGMTLHVEESRPGLEDPVVYVLPVEVEASPTDVAEDEAGGSTGTVLFVGGAVLLAVLGLMALRTRD